MIQLTCASCLHHRLINGGECRVEGPRLSDSGASYFPPMPAEAEECGQHSNFDEWSKQRRAQIRRELVRDHHDFDPLCGHNCECVRLGQGSEDPNRRRIELPTDRHLTVRVRCKHCQGTGKVPESTTVGPAPANPLARRPADIINDDEVEVPESEFDGEEILGEDGEPIDGPTDFDDMDMVDAMLRTLGR